MSTTGVPRSMEHRSSFYSSFNFALHLKFLSLKRWIYLLSSSYKLTYTKSKESETQSIKILNLERKFKLRKKSYIRILKHFMFFGNRKEET
jgi:hypothetical protein